MIQQFIFSTLGDFRIRTPEVQHLHQSIMQHLPQQFPEVMHLQPHLLRDVSLVSEKE